MGTFEMEFSAQILSNCKPRAYLPQMVAYPPRAQYKSRRHLEPAVNRQLGGVSPLVLTVFWRRLGRLGGQLGPLGCLLGPSGSLLGLSWGLSGASWGVLGKSWGR